MARITTGYTFGITRTEALICREMFDGVPIDDIARMHYSCRGADGQIDKTKLATARRKINALKHKPAFQECYRALVKELVMDNFGQAVKKLGLQIDDPNGWLANKAINDYLTRFGPQIMGEDNKEIVVRVEGMPELGTPDADDSVTE